MYLVVVQRVDSETGEVTVDLDYDNPVYRFQDYEEAMEYAKEYTNLYNQMALVIHEDDVEKLKTIEKNENAFLSELMNTFEKVFLNYLSGNNVDEFFQHLREVEQKNKKETKEKKFGTPLPLFPYKVNQPKQEKENKPKVNVHQYNLPFSSHQENKKKVLN